MIIGSDNFFAAYEQSRFCWFLTIKFAYDFGKTKMANGKKIVEMAEIVSKVLIAFLTKPLELCRQD